MPTFTVTYEYTTDAERLALEQALAFVSPRRVLARNASPGKVLAACEDRARQDGQQLLRTTLAAALRQRIAHDEQKGGPHASAPTRTPDAPRAATAVRS